MIIGREKELAALNELMDLKKNIAVVGDRGAGKSAVIAEALKDKKFDRILFSKDSRTLKTSLVNLAISSGCRNMDVAGENIPSLKRIFYRCFKKGAEYVVFDHINRAGPKFCSFLEYIMDNNVPLLTASRSADQKDGLLFAFERVMISSLDQEKTGALTSYYMKTFGIKTVHEDDFKKGYWYTIYGLVEFKIFKVIDAIDRKNLV